MSHHYYLSQAYHATPPHRLPFYIFPLSLGSDLYDSPLFRQFRFHSYIVRALGVLPFSFPNHHRGVLCRPLDQNYAFRPMIRQCSITYLYNMGDSSVYPI
jgi:hypothetical protein